jgi:hypothetical protein
VKVFTQCLIIIISCLFFYKTNAQKNAVNKNKVVVKNAEIKTNIIAKNLRPDSIKAFVLNDDGDTINKTDERNLKQGVWVLNFPARFGEPSQRLTGQYFDNKKVGYWFTYDGLSLTAKEHFNDGVLDGEAKYFEENLLIAMGNFRGVDPTKKFDTLNIYNPISDRDTIVIVPKTLGSFKQGLWQYFENNNLMKTEEYFLGEIVETKHKTESDSIRLAKQTARAQFLQNNLENGKRPFGGSKQKAPPRYTDLPADGKGIVPNVRVKKTKE